MKRVRVKIPDSSSCGCSGGTGNTADSCSSRTAAEGKCNGETSRSDIVRQVSTSLEFKDILGTWKARWGINRMNYKVEPGIYSVGKPDDTSPVLVTANYKMTFDALRKELDGLDAYILVLDTKGINVWCAAGKGTFGTVELINRIEKVNLASIVSHKDIILPQLGAPGIAAHIVTKQTGFKVIYGTVRAKDLKAFLENNNQASKEMRKVRFNIMDRLVLTPIELVFYLKILIFIFGALFILNSFGFGHYDFKDLYILFGAVFIGSVLVPVLLPFIPGRAFSFKGMILGLIWAAAVVFLLPGTGEFGLIKQIAYILILPSITSYIAMNFTGCSTYTSLSGVKREMRMAVPLMIFSCGLGICLLIVDSLLKILS